MTSTVRTRDGLSLSVEQHLLGGDSGLRGRIVIVHGYAEHKGRYGHVVAALLDAGYECLLFDLRGHGRSDGPRGHVVRFADYRNDLAQIIETAPVARAPLIILGHSLGGLIALDFAEHRPGIATAVATSSPFLAPAFSVLTNAAWLAGYLLPAVKVKNRLDPSWLSHDPKVVDAYRRDPLVFDTLTLGWWREVHQAQVETFARAHALEVPLLLMLGDADRIADPHRSRAFFQNVPTAAKRLAVYAGFFHEVLNELDRQRVIADLLAWLDDRSTSTVNATRG